jgi:hypothetical protein
MSGAGRDPRRRAAPRPVRVALAAMLLVVAASGCSNSRDPDPRYRPTESILEAVAVLRRHVPDDTYRFEPARDFTGRNVYRASLLRLENLERLHEEHLRTGHLDDVIAFGKARSLERLRAYDLAADRYRDAAGQEGPLRLPALQSAAFCDALHEATRMAPGRNSSAEDVLPTPTGRAEALAQYDHRTALLDVVLSDVTGTHYAFVVEEEIERADVERADYLVGTRDVYTDGNVRALASLQKLAVDHRGSKNANNHLLELADLYAELTDDYVQANPPESLTFDPAAFEALVESAARLYETVSNQDGAPEKLEASRRLEAFIAFTLQVDRDRFTR